MVGVGVGLGLVGAVLMRRAVASQLYNVNALDPLVMMSVVALLGLVALGACARLAGESGHGLARRVTPRGTGEAVAYEDYSCVTGPIQPAFRLPIRQTNGLLDTTIQDLSPEPSCTVEPGP